MWNQLLGTARLRKSDRKPFDLRSPFESDRDRVVFSASFRRLQDKTQVFPLEPHDFVRTRLTHSLEVAALGRSLGMEIGQWLVTRGELSAEQGLRDVPTLVETACLAHDLGNPPFGHAGEDAIRTWFRERLSDPAFDALDAHERKDLETFEGNAQGFRILTRLQRLHDEHGLNLTAATLGTFTKYPLSSDREGSPYGSKFGCFKSEHETWERVRAALGLAPLQRHPLAFLMEAADDMAYRIIDVEDAVRKRLVDVRTVAETLEPVLAEIEEAHAAYQRVLERFEGKRDDPDAEQALMHDVRLLCTRVLFRGAVQAFQENESRILEGTFRKDLLEHSFAADLARTLLSLGVRYAYRHEAVVALELKGFRTLHALLDRFVPACTAPRERRLDPRTREGKLYRLVSANQRYVRETYETAGSELYRGIQLACDHVSGMTDSYAVRMAEL